MENLSAAQSRKGVYKMENTENKAKATKTAEIVSYSVTGVISVDALDKDPKAAVKLLAERTALLNDTERVNIVKGGEYAGRLAWVITAINVAQACNAVKRTEQSTKKEQLADMLNMKKSSIYNYVKAGNKLLAYKYDKIPLSMYEFIKDDTAEMAYTVKVTVIEKIGSYSIKSENAVTVYDIYSAVKINNKNKSTATAFDVPANAVKEIKKASEIAVQDIDGRECYVLNGKDIDIHFLSIRK